MFSCCKSADSANIHDVVTPVAPKESSRTTQALKVTAIVFAVLAVLAIAAAVLAHTGHLQQAVGQITPKIATWMAVAGGSVLLVLLATAIGIHVKNKRDAAAQD